MWVLDKLTNWITNTGDDVSRGGNQPSNTASESQTRTLDANFSGIFVVGTVVRAGAGLYDVVVNAGEKKPAVVCQLPQSVGCYEFGVNDCHIPIEGSKVVIYLASAESEIGVVVAVLSHADLANPLSDANKQFQKVIQLWDAEPSATSATESAHFLPHKNPDDPDVINANDGKPLDIFPGNQAWINEQGVGLAVLNLLATLRGSDRARIDVSVLDDLVRIVSGYFRHIHAQGEDQIYNDGGRLTREVGVSAYQCEKSGFTAYGSPLLVDTGQLELLKNSTASRYRLTANVAAKKRLQMFLGYLGDLVNVFIANPPPAEAMETVEANSVYQGLMHTHLDASGRLQFRTAAGISLERFDRIPIPKKKHETWDPEGDKMEDIDDPVSEKKPFEFPKDHPYGRSLLMRDAMSWRNADSYRRVHDQSQSEGRTDFFLPEESQLPVPDDQYDKLGDGKEKFKDNDERRAYLNLEDDGSIVMRDAWGSEIVLRGGNIVLNCPGQIEVRSGRNIVNLAGHDFVAKARKSVDIVSTDKDVRIKANTNLHMLSEGRIGKDAIGGGGVLIESKSKHDFIQYKGKKGEDVISAGVVIKAKDSRVVLHGKTTQITASRHILVEGKTDSGGPADADIYAAVRSLILNADKQVLISVNDSSGVMITQAGSVVTGRTALLVGGHGVGVIRGTKAWVPLTEVDIPDIYGELKNTITKIYNILQVQDGWLEPFKPTDRKDIKFTYRLASQYGTNTGTEVYQATSFKVYQATWAFMKTAGHKLILPTIDTWAEYGVDDTYPWPGEVAYNGTGYVKLTAENNIEAGKEISKNRKQRVNIPGGLIEVSFHEYEVLI